MDADGTGRRVRRAAGAGTAALVLAALAGCVVPPAAGSSAPAVGAVADDTADFTDPQRWASLPQLLTDPVLSVEDLGSALPGGAPWNPAIVDMDPPWDSTWCDDEEPTVPPRQITGLDAPDDDRVSYWSGGGGPAVGGRYVMVDVVRWSPRDGAELTAAREWGEALVADAARCASAVVLDAAGVPGEEPLLTATPQSSGSWRVQAVTTGGPTGLRFDVGVTAATAEEAGAVVAGLVTTAVGRLASADDLAGHLRDHPAARPDLTAEHLLADTQFDSGTAADPPATPGSLLPERVVAGWCEGAPLLNVVLPEQAWGTSWAKPATEGVDILAVDERLLRFTGTGDAEGLAAVEAYSWALRGGAAACSGAEVVELDGDQVLPEWHGTDVLVSGVDEGDGTWTTTVTARDGVTVLVLVERGTAPMGWSTGLALGLLESAWSRVREADRAPGATAPLGSPAALADPDPVEER